MPVLDSLPQWFVRTIASMLALVLVLTLVGLALLLPYVPRLARAGAALPDAVAVVEQAPTTLEQVDRIDGNVEAVVPPVLSATKDIPRLLPLLRDLIALAGDLRGDVAGLQKTVGPLESSASELVTVGKQVEALQESLRSLQTQLSTLQRLGEPLTQLANTAEPLPESLERLNTSAAAIADLTDVIRRMEKHVANLDRKTGPVLFPALP